MTDNKPPYKYQISATLTGTIDLNLWANNQVQAAHLAEQVLKELCSTASRTISEHPCQEVTAKILPDSIWVDWEQTTGIYQREGIKDLDERSV